MGMFEKRQLIVANWKMHGLCESGRELVTQVTLNKAHLDHIVLCPPFTLLYQIQQAISGTELRMGAQDCHWEEKGAFTGDISAQMLRDDGCQFVIVGHSERRAAYHETDVTVKKKAEAAHKASVIPIICVGESKKVRDEGRAIEFVCNELRHCLPENAKAQNVVIAYEPIWAIGTGETATIEQIAEMHAAINKCVADHYPDFEGVADPLYGGSVTPENAKEILDTDGVGGVLIGSASLDPDAFRAIVEASH